MIVIDRAPTLGAPAAKKPSEVKPAVEYVRRELKSLENLRRFYGGNAIAQFEEDGVLALDPDTAAFPYTTARADALAAKAAEVASGIGDVTNMATLIPNAYGENLNEMVGSLQALINSWEQAYAQETKPLPTWIWIALGVAGAGTAGTVIYFKTRRRRRRKR